MTDEPIQVVQISHSGRRPRFSLQDELKYVLEKAGDHDTCLISTVGASRLGKSCFLSYLIRYLHYLEQCPIPSTNWLPPNSSEKVLGFPYKNSVDRQTTGFWIWPRPFLIPGPTGKKIAVFVMDTQGVFDDRTMTEWSAIFGLALLTSSTLLYNLHFNPNEDALIILETFLQYGIMTLEQPEDANPNSVDEAPAPFQKLFCLIRDWNPVGSYEYGFIGGKQFIDKWLATDNPKLPTDAKQRRIHIRKCFEKIQGSLLPDPGDKAKSELFQGATADLSEPFYTNLKNTIERICEPVNLSPSKICGRKATYQDLLSLFQNYVETINSSSTPAAKNFLEANHQASCDGAAKNAFSYFNENVTQKFTREIFIPIQELKDQLAKFEQEALAKFNLTKKLGNKNIISQHKSRLSAMIKSRKEEIIHEQSNNFDAIVANLVQQARDKFNQEFLNYRQQHRYEDYEIPIPLEEFEATLKQISHTVLEIFDNNPALENEELAELFFEKLDAELILLRANFRSKNSHALKKFEDRIAEVTGKLVNEYSEEMDSSTSFLPFQDEDKLRKLDTKLRNSVLKKFDKIPESELPKALKPHAQEKLTEKMAVSFALKLQENANAIHEAETELNALVSSLVNNFKDQLQSRISKSKAPPTEGKLDFEHMKLKDGAEQEFLLKCNFDDLKFSNPFRFKLGEAIDTAYQDIVNNLAEGQNMIEAQIKSWMGNQQKEFQKRLINHGNIGSFNPADYRNICLNIEKQLVNETEGQLQTMGIQPSSQILHIERLNRTLKEISDALCAEHESLLEMEMNKGRTYIDQISVAKYMQLMTPSRDTLQSTLINKHQSSLISIKQEFANKWSNLPSINLNNLKSELEQRIQPVFESLQEQVDIEDKKVAAKVQTAMKNSTTLYHEKMANKYKFRHVEECELKDQHKTCKKLAIQSFVKEIGDICNDVELMKLDLDDRLDNLFADALQDFNNMKKSNQEIEIADAVKSSVSSYATKMQKFFNGPVGDEKLFKQFHSTSQSSALHILEQFLGKFRDTIPDIEKFNTDFKNQIDKSYQDFQQQLKLSLASLEDKLIEYELTITTEHSTMIRQAAEELLSPNDEILDGKHSQFVADALDGLKSKFPSLSPTKLANSGNKLANSFDTTLAKVKEQYVQKFGKFQEIIKTLDNEIKKELAEADDPDWDETERSHTERANDYWLELRNFCNFPSQELLSTFEEQYKSATKKIFSDNKTVFNNEVDPHVLNPVLASACSLYEAEMKKHMPNLLRYVDPNQVRNWHHQVTQHVTGCIKEQKVVKMTALVKSKLKQKFQALLKQWEERNFKNSPTKEIAIGIDLGTTFSCVAIYEISGDVKVLENAQGNRTTPSYIHIINETEDVVGEVAKLHALTHPGAVIFDAKRLIGRQFNDPLVQKDIKNWPFSVVEDSSGNPLIEVHGQTYEPEVISSKILAKLKQDAEAKLGMGRKIKSAVITVPAYFNDGQRQATKDAGLVAGFDVLELLNEPTAAAVAYSYDYSNEQKCVLVFDLGGGTFDVAVLSIFDGNVTVAATDGDTHLGGEDFDSKLMDHCIQEFISQNPTIDIMQGKTSTDNTMKLNHNKRLRRLRSACETAKITLSASKIASVALDAFFVGETATDHRDLSIEITRDQFEAMNDVLFKKCIQLVENILIASKKSKFEINEILLVGGSSKIPKIQSMLSTFFNKKALNKTLNPDEAVARGAAIRAAVLSGYNSIKSTLQDVTPMSIGIKVKGGDLSVIFPRNFKYPDSKTKQYHTGEEDQHEVEIAIYEGEHTKATDNHLLGRFDLSGIPPGPAESQVITVIMDIDRNGILSVTAKCEFNGVTKKLTIQEDKNRLSEERKELLSARQQNCLMPSRFEP